MKVSEQIANLKPYQPGKPISETKREFGLTEVCKLASNENPLGPSPKVIEALQQALQEIHRYPDASSFEVRQSLKKYYEIEGHRMAFGNGSNELIDLLIRIYCEPGQSILTSEAAFIAYKICSQAARVNCIEVPLTSELKIDLKAMADEVEKSQPRLVFLPNPNNPTGTYVSEGELLEFLEKVKDQELLVILDEAYCEFVRAKDYPNSRPLLDKYPNLVSLRTLSKVYGLAGLRFGVLLGSPEVMDLVDRVRNPFNVNSLAQAAVCAAVEDLDYCEKARHINSSGLDYFYKELDELGLKYWPSEGNFVLFDCGEDGAQFCHKLLQKGLIARPVKGYGLMTHVRLSVGLPDENEFAIKCIKSVLEK